LIYGKFGIPSKIFAYTYAVIDEKTGLYYMNARYYDLATARFISKDPVRDGDNWYMYCARIVIDTF